MDNIRTKKAKKKSDGNTLIVLGVLLGLGIGAGLALAYSRGNGSQNRRELNQWAHKRLDVVQHRIEGVVKREA